MRRVGRIGGLLIAAACTTLAATAWAATWVETYSGTGSSDTEALACMGAENSVKPFEIAACASKRGRKWDVDYGDCRCSAIEVGDGEIHTCKVRLKVTCENDD